MSKASAKHDELDDNRNRDMRDAADKETAETGITRKGEHHGLSLAQIKRVEDARHDDTDVPPPLTLPSGEPPILESISPNTAVIGGPDVTMTASGIGFTEASVISFNGGEEPTTFVDGGRVTTIVKPSTATTPGSYPVTVANGDKVSGEASFTFTEAGAFAAVNPEGPTEQPADDTAERKTSGSWGLAKTDADPADPDELEDEIEQAEEEGEFKSTHPKTKTKTKR
jgi:hypothetical protein